MTPTEQEERMDLAQLRAEVDRCHDDAYARERDNWY